MANMVSTKSSMQNEEQRIDNDEMGLKDILSFFKRSHRPILLFGVVGLVFASTYLALVSKKYEAGWQMQMAQFVDNSNKSNCEEPAALIQRLRTPTVYPVEVQQNCGIEGVDFSDYLGGKLKVDAIKGVNNAVTMKVSASSKEQAKQCAEAVVAMIVVQQRGLIEERLAGRQVQLAQYQQSLQEERQQLEKITKSELGNFAYLTKLDKLSWLRTRIDALQEEAMLSKLHPAKLLAPIYAPNTPVSTKTGLVLLLGLALGVMLGLLYALGREGWRRVI